MQVESIKIDVVSDLERKINISVPPEEVNKKFDEFFSNIAKDVVLPGFRKGKAPTYLIRQKYEQNAKTTVAQTLVNEYYMKAVSTFDFIPVGSPRTEKFDTEYLGTFDADNTYKISLSIDIVPKIEPQGYMGLNIELPNYNRDAIFQERAAKLSKDYAVKEEMSDYGAQLGDSLVVDFTGYMDGVAFDGGHAENYTLNDLGSSNFIAGFEDQLVGIKRQETREVLVTFPDTYHVESLAGRPASFNVFVHTVVKNTALPFGEDLALLVGFDSVEALTAKINEEIEMEISKNNSALAEHQMVTALVALNTFDIPQQLYAQETNRLVNTVGYQNLNQEIVDRLQETAKNNVKGALILNAIYEKESALQVSKEEFDAELANQAAQMGQEVNELVNVLSKANQLENFIGTIKKNKVISFILSNANISTKE